MKNNVGMRSNNTHNLDDGQSDRHDSHERGSVDEERGGESKTMHPTMMSREEYYRKLGYTEEFSDIFMNSWYHMNGKGLDMTKVARMIDQIMFFMDIPIDRRLKIAKEHDTMTPEGAFRLVEAQISLLENSIIAAKKQALRLNRIVAEEIGGDAESCLVM